MAKLTDQTLVIIPTYNENENIGSIIPKILQTINTEVLVVDDNSPDQTGEIVKKLAADDPHIHLLTKKGKSGLGEAYKSGFKWALERDYQTILQMDADFSHQPRYLPILKKNVIRSKFDLAIGSRYVKGGGVVNWPLKRKILSRGGSIYARSILGVNIKDLTGGFKCFRRQVLEAINPGSITSSGFIFQVEVTFRAIKAGFRVKEFPIIFPERERGYSKMSGKIIKEALLKMWEIRRQRPPY